MIINNEAQHVMGNDTLDLCSNILWNEKLEVLKMFYTFRFKNNFAQKIVESYPNLQVLVVNKKEDNEFSVQELLADQYARTETLKKTR